MNFLVEIRPDHFKKDKKNIPFKKEIFTLLKGNLV